MIEKPEPKQPLHTVRILNISKQMIPLQVRPPGGDFFIHEQQVRLAVGGSAILPKSYLMDNQIRNLTAKRMIQVVYDSALNNGHE